MIQVLNKMIWTFYVKPPSLPTVAQYTKEKIGHFSYPKQNFLTNEVFGIWKKTTDA